MLAREQANPALLRRWTRHILFSGDEEYTFRPGGYYVKQMAHEAPVFTEFERGRYELAGNGLALKPYSGGVAAYQVDIFGSTLTLIEPKPFVQAVLLGQELPGSQAAVLETTRQAQAERARKGWHVGIWEVPAPGAWLEFTFRPDHRYIAKSGTQGVPSQVERGRYVAAPGKFTLAPYPANGSARGFEFDLYAGDLFLIGDPQRLVAVRKIPGSEAAVMDKAIDPAALKGERGSGGFQAPGSGRLAEVVGVSS